MATSRFSPQVAAMKKSVPARIIGVFLRRTPTEILWSIVFGVVIQVSAQGTIARARSDEREQDQPVDIEVSSDSGNTQNDSKMFIGFLGWFEESVPLL